VGKVGALVPRVAYLLLAVSGKDDRGVEKNTGIFWILNREEKLSKSWRAPEAEASSCSRPYWS